MAWITNSSRAVRYTEKARPPVAKTAASLPGQLVSRLVPASIRLKINIARYQAAPRPGTGRPRKSAYLDD